MAKKKSAKKSAAKTVETIVHEDEKRKNIPTAEFQSVVAKEQTAPKKVKYPRNVDLDPQLVWRGKDEQDWSDLVVHAPPLYIQEKVHPKVLVDDLIKQTTSHQPLPTETQLDLFSDFNGVPAGDAKTEFYQHDQNWSNRMILGDSLQVMASLAEREGLRGRVQCIYIDPPYGIRFNSNFQWSTTSRDVKDGNSGHITREPEQVKAFRDTWRDGVHSYLSYLRDRLTAARDLLADTGSLFLQTGEENAHLLRSLADEIFGSVNFCRLIPYVTTSFQADLILGNTTNYLLWYAKNKESLKVRSLFYSKDLGDDLASEYKWKLTADGRIENLSRSESDGSAKHDDTVRPFRYGPLTSQGTRSGSSSPFTYQGKVYSPGSNHHWKVSMNGMEHLARSGMLISRTNSLSYYMFLGDFPVSPIMNIWTDMKWGFDAGDKLYVVQTNAKIVQRCLLMATDPGDLVLDPTCGSGTTAHVAEQWGRRWITIDTSRVALALARARIMGARYPYYLLADSREGQQKEAEVTQSAPSTQPTRGNIRHGFVCERVPHITLKSIANNAEIDVIWEKWQERLEPLRAQLNKVLGTDWQEWEIPRDLKETLAKAQSRKDEKDLDKNLRALAALREMPKEAAKLHAEWWEARIARQREIDASIAAKAEFEYLYDKPYEDKKKVRVAGPFTVESLSPHRTLGVDENDELIDPMKSNRRALSVSDGSVVQDFTAMILENLRTAGVQQAHKDDKIAFTSLAPWPGTMVCAAGTYQEGDAERRAAIFIGPEFGTVQRQDLVEAAREAGDADFNVLVACAFNYEAHATEFNKLGRIPVLKARMNADLHMAEDLKNTGKGNLFVIFGEPDIEILPAKDTDGDQIRVKVNGVDVFHPNTGEVRSDGADGIACWFIDTDYNDESFFVRHAYFLGASDPYKSLKTTLKAEINEEAWESLHSDTSRPFEKPKSGKIAVKVINHLGDEVMKVFRVEL
jgi:adenine-specific DNA-methyltransferase